jgi:hypothetical protein
MTYTIIDIYTPIDPAVETNDSVTSAYSTDTDIGAFQWSVGGATRSVDIVLESRLDDRFDWKPYGVGATGVRSDDALEIIDLAPLSVVRVRIVNNDGVAGNTADVDAVVVTP